MARKKTTPKDEPKPKKVEWQGFVNVYLNSQEKQYIKENELDDNGLIDLVQRLADSNYKFSCSFSDRGGFYTVTAYGNTPDNPNAGWAMSLKHSDFRIAMTALNHCLQEAGEKGSWAERYVAASGHDW